MLGGFGTRMRRKQRHKQEENGEIWDLWNPPSSLSIQASTLAFLMTQHGTSLSPLTRPCSVACQIWEQSSYTWRNLAREISRPLHWLTVLLNSWIGDCTEETQPERPHLPARLVFWMVVHVHNAEPSLQDEARLCGGGRHKGRPISPKLFPHRDRVDYCESTRWCASVVQRSDGFFSEGATGFSPKKPMKTASAIAPSCRARLWLNLVSSTTQTRLQASFNHCLGNHCGKFKSSMMRGHQWPLSFSPSHFLGPGVLGGPSSSICIVHTM